MVTIVIVGVLAALATYGVSRYVATSKAGEAIQMIGSIKAAEESYKDETFAYLDVSGSFGSDAFYPHSGEQKPGQDRVVWGADKGTLDDKWAVLGVNPSGPVLFAYACVAGQAGTKPTDPSDSDLDIENWPATAAGAPWYVIKAKADLDGDGSHSTVFAAASFTTQIFSNHAGE